MIFPHEQHRESGGSFCFGANVPPWRTLPCTELLSELWIGFTFHLSDIEFRKTDGLFFSVGDAETEALLLSRLSPEIIAAGNTDSADYRHIGHTENAGFGKNELEDQKIIYER